MLCYTDSGCLMPSGVKQSDGTEPCSLALAAEWGSISETGSIIYPRHNLEEFLMCFNSGQKRTRISNWQVNGAHVYEKVSHIRLQNQEMLMNDLFDSLHGVL